MLLCFRSSSRGVPDAIVVILDPHRRIHETEQQDIAPYIVGRILESEPARELVQGGFGNLVADHRNGADSSDDC